MLGSCLKMPCGGFRTLLGPVRGRPEDTLVLGIMRSLTGRKTGPLNLLTHCPIPLGPSLLGNAFGPDSWPKRPIHCPPGQTEDIREEETKMTNENQYCAYCRPTYS